MDQKSFEKMICMIQQIAVNLGVSLETDSSSSKPSECTEMLMDRLSVMKLKTDELYSIHDEWIGELQQLEVDLRQLNCPKTRRNIRILLDSMKGTRARISLFGRKVQKYPTSDDEKESEFQLLLREATEEHMAARDVKEEPNVEIHDSDSTLKFVNKLFVEKPDKPQFASNPGHESETSDVVIYDIHGLFDVMSDKNTSYEDIYELKNDVGTDICKLFVENCECEVGSVSDNSHYLLENLENAAILLNNELGVSYVFDKRKLLDALGMGRLGCLMLISKRQKLDVLIQTGIKGVKFSGLEIQDNSPLSSPGLIVHTKMKSTIVKWDVCSWYCVFCVFDRGKYELKHLSSYGSDYGCEFENTMSNEVVLWIYKDKVMKEFIGFIFCDKGKGHLYKFLGCVELEENIQSGLCKLFDEKHEVEMDQDMMVMDKREGLSLMLVDYFWETLWNILYNSPPDSNDDSPVKCLKWHGASSVELNGWAYLHTILDYTSAATTGVHMLVYSFICLSKPDFEENELPVKWCHEVVIESWVSHVEILSEASLFIDILRTSEEYGHIALDHLVNNPGKHVWQSKFRDMGSQIIATALRFGKVSNQQEKCHIELQIFNFPDRSHKLEARMLSGIVMWVIIYLYIVCRYSMFDKGKVRICSWSRKINDQYEAVTNVRSDAFKLQYINERCMVVILENYVFSTFMMPDLKSIDFIQFVRGDVLNLIGFGCDFSVTLFIVLTTISMLNDILLHGEQCVCITCGDMVYERGKWSPNKRA